MAARSTMASLIARVRLLINDTSGSPQFTDDDIQGVMDETRVDASNLALTAYPTFSGSTIQYLDYYSDLGNWEDGFVLKQYLTVTVTPSSSEPIVGHFTFSASKLPPIYITGSMHDIYRAAADLLERLAARWVLQFSFASDGQSFQRGQAATALQTLAMSYRKKQRAHVIGVTRSDTQTQATGNGLGATPLDYMASGDN